MSRRWRDPTRAAQSGPTNANVTASPSGRRWNDWKNVTFRIPSEMP
jgi:hypothetical protein